MKKVYLTILSICFTSAVLAANDSTKVASPFKFNGFVDSYYFVNTNRTLTNLGASGLERVFDQKANSFEVGMAQMKATYTNHQVEAVIDLAFGNSADLANYNNFISPLGASKTSTSLALKQAYASYKPNDKLTLTAGQFATSVGYEVIDMPYNYNYSLSNLFGNGPFYHTGVKAAYAFSDKFALMAGVVDGLDSKDDINKSKGIVSQVMFKPKDTWTVYLNYFVSNEGAATKSTYHLTDITTNYQITEKFYLGLNAAYGSQSAKNWWGIAGYSNYSITDKIGLGLRYEYFDNKSGIRSLVNAQGLGTAVNSLTITSIVKLTPNLLFKPEFRTDSYLKGSNQFKNSDGKSVNSQSTIGGAVIFYF